ncbi:SDR family oxidoreductase [Kutzneria viridogrisea]|uniref:Thioester reductase-like protein n=1 Tax=Kutzneria viridogrisea TaxID=47990 RepID=A0ABR6BUM0_9PSEU|nr:thioester reductase-like protein [Kutzneria viridogrisea]
MAIAITGATGLLGTRLLEQLAAQHQLVLLCRNGGVPAEQRVLRYLRAAGRTQEEIEAVAARIRVVHVELDKPRLGLGEDRFRSLADELDAVWHSAASIDLNANTQELHRINTVGTRRVIELADAGVRRPMLHHVSSIGVVGRKPVGRIFERDLDDSYGFTTRYEESKYLAEVAVREWSARTGRPAVVHRPSVLITDQSPHPDLPSHPLLTGMQLARKLVASFAVGANTGGERLVVRIPGDPQAGVNMLPVDDAARLMVAIAGHAPSSGVDTYHVVHPQDVRMALLAEVFEELFAGLLPVTWRFVPSAPREPTPWESLVYQTMATFLPFISYRRKFDDRGLRDLGLTGPATPPVDRDYLMRALGGSPAMPPQRVPEEAVPVL